MLVLTTGQGKPCHGAKRCVSAFGCAQLGLVLGLWRPWAPMCLYGVYVFASLGCETVGCLDN